MKAFLVFAAVVLLMVFQLSCAKSYNNTDRTLTGQIVDSVTNGPISNTSFVLYTYDRGGGNHGDTYDKFSFATNSEGYFNVTFNYKEKGGNKLEIQYPKDDPTFKGGFRFVWKGNMGDKSTMDVGIIRAYKE